MMAAMDNTTQRRITFLSLLSSAATAGATPGIIDQDAVYHTAQDWLERMEEDGFFKEAPASRPTQRSSSAPRPASPRQDSPSRPSNRGRDNNTPFTGQLRDPDGPPTDKQVAAALKLTDEYSEDDLYSFTKQQVSDLISDLKG